jgi:hypothetical protein
MAMVNTPSSVSLNVTKGFLKNLDTGVVQSFMYNPTTISDEQQINFSELGGAGFYKKLQYVGLENPTIPVELFMRTRYAAKIQEFLTFLEEFVPKDRFTAPPEALFCLGSYIKKVVITSISIERNEFDKDLQVIEAKVKLNLKEVKL